jgi:hypothetical protein
MDGIMSFQGSVIIEAVQSLKKTASIDSRAGFRYEQW